jgi:NAD/NADP transhydrogenase beta subunit
MLGILGVGSGILSSLAAVGFPPAVLAQFGAVSAIGGTIGTIIGRRITATELPQMVAALHSVVGLAAVFTSIGSVLADVSHISTLHFVTAYLGVLIGVSSRCASPHSPNDPLPDRGCHFYWLYSGLPETGWSHVIKTIHTPKTPSDQ